MKNTPILKDIPLAGILIGLIGALNIFCSFFPIIFGYSINIYFVVFAIGLVILKTNIIKIVFFLMVPFILMLYPNIYFINIIQVIIEYILAIWCFFPFIFGNFIINKLKNNKLYMLIVFSNIFIFCWFLKFLLHVIAGYFWWTDNSLIGSIIINAPIIASNLLLTIPIFILIFNRIIQVCERYYLNIWIE